MANRYLALTVRFEHGAIFIHTDAGRRPYAREERLEQTLFVSYRIFLERRAAASSNSL